MRTIDKGFESQIENARQAVVRSPDEWNQLWRQHAGERARPPVDFSREIVVAVFLGTRPTAGYDVEIMSAVERDSALVIGYREARPASGTVTAQVLTSPYHIAAVPKHLTVRFERLEK